MQSSCPSCCCCSSLESMESAAASAFLKTVMGRLFMALEKEYNKHRGLAQESHSLQQDLRMIAAAMDDHQLSMGKSDAAARTAVARLHTEEMLDLAHDIEDCVDRFLHRLTCNHHKRGGAGAGASLLRRVTHELSKVKSRSSFGDEIQKLKKRLREAHQRVLTINPPPILTAGGGQHTASSSSAAVAPPCRAARSPVGIGEDVEELLSMLDEVEGEPVQMRVVSVVGFGGLGKTTLAKAVYDDPRAKDKFRHRAWVAAGGSPEIRGILRDVLQQVRPDDAMDVDGQRLEASLKDYLKDKR